MQGSSGAGAATAAIKYYLETMNRLVIGYDVGTGGCKAVLATAGGKLLATEFEPYGVDYPRQHCAEQEPSEWWKAASETTRRLLATTGEDPDRVVGIAFATQMLGVVPMSDAGVPLTPGIIWMDCRADTQARTIVRRAGGKRIVMMVAGAVPSGKDVICKLKWIKEEEPDIYERTRAFLDVKGYLVYRATGKFLTDQSAASVTGLMDDKTRGWSRIMSVLLGVTVDKMPPVQKSIDIAGELTPEAAADMGLPAGTPVVAGMGDAPAGPVGAGALDHGEAVISIGTSGLLLITVNKKVKLGKYGMASIAAASPGMWLLVGETNTAGSCLAWFAEQLSTAEERRRAETEPSIFRVLDGTAEGVPAGSNKLIFTPWMYGERAPVTDTTLRGAFVNLSLDHTREDMLHSIYEGVAFNFRWMLEAARTKELQCRTVRAIGGGATSDVWMQVLSDITGRRIEAVESAREAGAMGAALAVTLALGIYQDYGDIKEVVKVRKTFDPDKGKERLYDLLFSEFKSLYKGLSPVCRSINR
jgi:xylulokinase